MATTTYSLSLSQRLTKPVFCLRGDNDSLVLVVSHSANFTVSKAWFTAKLYQEDEDADAVLAYTSADNPATITITGNGTKTVTITIPLAGADTQALTERAFYYDVQVLVSSVPRTLLLGTFYLQPDITRARS